MIGLSISYGETPDEEVEEFKDILVETVRILDPNTNYTGDDITKAFRIK